LENILIGLTAVLHWNYLGWILIGTVAGIWIGAIPGLGPVMATAVILPFTFAMEPLSALLLLASVHAAGNYGGSIGAILLNIPGEATSAATTFDGYPMARQGKARVALGISAASSLVGALCGITVLATSAGPILNVALKFGPSEFFALSILGLTVVAVATTGSTAKGLLMGCVGLAVSFIGVDAVMGVPRFTFGSLYMQAGINFVPVMIGLFAVSELMMLVLRGGTIAETGRLEGSLMQGVRDTFRYPATLFKCTALGIGIGAIPGVGSTAANFMAYAVAQKTSRERDKFGEGATEGVIAPESSNNACTSATLIPALTLGIPGGAGSAILLVAITIHGLRPGGMLFSSNPELIYGFFAGLFIGSVLFFIFGLLMTPWFALITVIKVELLAPVLLVASLTGAYAYQQNISDVFVAIFFGVVGFFARQHGYPVIGLVVGLILGKLAEQAFHQALMLHGGDYTVFLTRPITVATFLICLLLIAGPEISKQLKARISRAKEDLPE
jgi:putative tricarboxylic transport membrane protein